MYDWPILSLTTFLPTIGAVIILFIRGDEADVARNARWAALFASVLTFILSLFIWAGFNPASAEFQMVERVEWLPAFNVAYVMGIDGISARVIDVTRGVVRLQTGYVYHYAFAMLIGVAALITWFMFAGAH